MAGLDDYIRFLFSLWLFAPKQSQRLKSQYYYGSLKRDLGKSLISLDHYFLPKRWDGVPIPRMPLWNQIDGVLIRRTLQSSVGNGPLTSHPRDTFSSPTATPIPPGKCQSFPQSTASLHPIPSFIISLTAQRDRSEAAIYHPGMYVCDVSYRAFSPPRSPSSNPSALCHPPGSAASSNACCVMSVLANWPEVRLRVLFSGVLPITVPFLLWGPSPGADLDFQRPSRDRCWGREHNTTHRISSGPAGCPRGAIICTHGPWPLDKMELGGRALYIPTTLPPSTQHAACYPKTAQLMFLKPITAELLLTLPIFCVIITH